MVMGRVVRCVALLTAMATAACDSQPRRYHMGFTLWPYAATVEAVADTAARVQQHGDLVAIHLDAGVPWPEAYAGTEYAAGFRADLDRLQASVPATHELYLAVTPLNTSRNGLASYRGDQDNQPLPEPWNTYDFATPAVREAYTRYCLDLLGRFQPRYFNYAIEATGLIENNPELWDDMVGLMAYAYPRIKAEFPEVLIGFSAISHHPLTSSAAALRAHIGEALPYTDYLGVSTYLYLGNANGNPAYLPPDWLSQFRDMAGGKPVAVTETGWLAEDLVVPAWSINLAGEPSWQAAYVEKLLTEAQRLDALFVVWFTVVDYDALMVLFPPGVYDLGLLWRDTGLFNERLEARPGLVSWDARLARGYLRPPESAGGTK